MRYLAVVDGEHYPPVTEAALAELQGGGHDIVVAVLVGGKEKLAAGDLEVLGSVSVLAGDDPREVLYRAIAEHRPDCVFDLSDEPVLDYRRRHELVAVALAAGVPYQGPDFRFWPPARARVALKPSLALIGTGKRTGKTAVAGFAARTLVEHGHRPVVVAMGRGGPAEPEVLRGDEVSLTPRQLLELADSGAHAASDYIEDALLGRVPTVGCRRCGGGLAGGVEISNVAAGVRIANDLPGDLLILEGSGAAIPPVHADATGLVVPAHIPFEYLTGYLGPYRLLLADFVVVTMCEHPFASPSRISEITSRISEAFRLHGNGEMPPGEVDVVRTVFRPTPTRDIAGSEVFVATTAPQTAAPGMKHHLESEHECRVVGISHSLSDRSKLEAELNESRGEIDILLCEIKASGVDVATRWALDADVEVVYMDNVPQGVDGDDPAAAVVEAARLAQARYTPPGNVASGAPRGNKN
jgi:cyclic 2,3-diphosphoglycerate synthase